MTECTQKKLELPGFDRRKIEVEFSQKNVTSDGGNILLRLAEKVTNLCKRIAKILPDDRNQTLIQHTTEEMLSQRVFSIALGYEDLNDQNTLRHDPALQVAVEKSDSLASSPTLCRFENRADKQTAWNIHQIMVDTFIASFKEAPKELVFDFDATDDLIHGNQEKSFFHGYYRNYCFLPLYVFCGEQLLVSYLRPSNQDGAKHAGAILKLLVKQVRQEWPDVRIIFRGDSGFFRKHVISWCERNDVGYITGLAQNKRLNTMTKNLQKRAENQYYLSGEKQRLFKDLQYAARSWKTTRRVIVKAEHTEKGSNPRYIVTNLEGNAQDLYDNVYCARGEMENRIKEQQLYLFAGRTSCHDWWPNQFRLLLSGLAYILMETIRRLGLEGTELAKAQCQTIRLKLFKIGGIILQNTRRICFKLSSRYPYQDLFFTVANRLLFNTA